MTTYDLGRMTGGTIHQYANPVGQVYYVDLTAGTTSYSIPNGYGDAPGDTWSSDLSKPWPQWNNNRTGRATLIDPSPPPLQTYLDDINIKAALNILVEVPDSNGHVYRRPIGGILRFIFPITEGYDVVQETGGDSSRADFSTFKASRRPGGTLYRYDFLLAESKERGQPWGATEDQLHSHLASNGNDSKNCYGMIQIGLEVQYYRYQQGVFSKIGGKMHLITYANDVIAWGKHIKDNPMPFV